ncbi:hypothetical protein HPB48_001618 [Haemaphysalis longicornis]|uniref:Uncharacterized protein n=1 Tax=Haemaphysalis longicornis TaxID=44386 RepID=A0A9J6FD53_HAELO|nr:hypothetical protein HPB48_001618 [Haemaphysalis longicornis]
MSGSLLCYGTGPSYGKAVGSLRATSRPRSATKKRTTSGRNGEASADRAFSQPRKRHAPSSRAVWEAKTARRSGRKRAASAAPQGGGAASRPKRATEVSAELAEEQPDGVLYDESYYRLARSLVTCAARLEALEDFFGIGGKVAGPCSWNLPLPCSARAEAATFLESLGLIPDSGGNGCTVQATSAEQAEEAAIALALSGTPEATTILSDSRNGHRQLWPRERRDAGGEPAAEDQVNHRPIYDGSRPTSESSQGERPTANEEADVRRA